jgi:TrmH family RNA methyltransferase
VAEAARLKDRTHRAEVRRFLVEGAQVVAEAIASGATIHDVFHTDGPDPRVAPTVAAAQAAGIPTHAVAPPVMRTLAGTTTPQGIVAVAGFVDVPLSEVGHDGGPLAVLVEVRDPGNLGTIVRTADAAGACGVVLSRSSVDVYNPKVVRATAGSLFHLAVVREAEPLAAVDHLRAAGFRILAAMADGDLLAHEADLSGPTAFLFGNEARGLSAQTLAAADATVRIPLIVAGKREITYRDRELVRRLLAAAPGR